MGMGLGVLRAQEKNGGGAEGVACVHKIYRAQTQVRRELCLAVLGKGGQGKGRVVGLSDLSSFIFFLAGPCPRSWPLRAHQNFSLQVPSAAGGMGHWGMLVHKTWLEQTFGAGTGRWPLGGVSGADRGGLVALQ